MTKKMKKGRLARIVGFALVAFVSAGAHCPPPGPCFADIGPRPTLRMVLGEQVRGDNGWPSCAGIDGIMSSSVFTLHLVKNYDTACDFSDYRAERVEGVPDVTLDPTNADSELAFAIANGDFSSSQSTGCRGTWSLNLGPSNGLAARPSALPVDDPTGWFVRREMTIAQAQFCDGVFQEAGSVYCKDTFAVSSITEVAR